MMGSRDTSVTSPLAGVVMTRRALTAAVHMLSGMYKTSRMVDGSPKADHKQSRTEFVEERAGKPAQFAMASKVVNETMSALVGSMASQR